MRVSPPVDLPALTSLRFFAAAMIFVFHLREFAPADWLYRIAPGMYHGVSFFFVLSGFVLTHAHLGRPIDAGRFYLARLARIAPLHLASLALLLAVLPLPAARGQNLGAAESVLSFVLKTSMLDAWAPTRALLQSWNNVSWSISVEIAFYAAFPLLLPAMRRWPARTLAAVAALSLGVLAAGALAGLPLFSLDRDALSLFNLGSCFPPARAFEFALGMACRLAWGRWLQKASLSPAAWTIIEAVALSAAAAWLLFAVPALLAGGEGAAFVWMRAAGSCWLFALLLAALAGGRGAFGRALALRPLAALGEASFAFYMAHMIVMRALRYHFGAGPGALSALALSLALAFLLHHAVEIPLRRRILALRAPGLAPAAKLAAWSPRS
ncbi:MAG: acyltransferase [Pseudomonadota bacterium]|nr:acyltransferase [Pseudomonadota bacterium]